MEDNVAKELLRRYIQGTCTPEERELVESWYINETSLNRDDSDHPDYNAAKTEIWSKIKKERPVKVKSKSLLPRIAAAAMVILTVGVGIYSLHPRKAIQQDSVALQSNIRPGGNKATLILANGGRISLTDAPNGALAEQSGIKITKTADGQLIYEIAEHNASASGKSGSELLNTIETPAGGEYQINLPDGTKVWLNASSSLRFPVNFTGNERKVELKGEGYFEVARQVRKPFKVISAGQTVEVLGTHFNINTYADEQVIRTTLLEGSVQINNHNNVKRILKPGQQSVLRAGGLKILPVDTEQVIAWHKGDFAFEGATLQTIMRQISRWYNVEVVYQGTIAEVEFGGSISRSKSIEEVLKVLQMTQGVHFKLEGRSVLVMP